MSLPAVKLFKHSAHHASLFLSRTGHKIQHQNKLISFMMSLLRFGMTKDEIKNRPLKSFNGKVFVINNAYDQYRKENRTAIEIMKNSTVIGFDTESKVDWHKVGSNHLPISLIQLSNEDIVILWRLRKGGKLLQKQFPSSLRDILCNDQIKKIGTGNNNDLSSLYEQYSIVISNIIDNQNIAKKLGLNKIGLESLTAQLLNWRMSKARSKRLSNWEAHKLSPVQINYAATDSWASLMVYKKLHDIEKKLFEEPLGRSSSFEKILLNESEIDNKLFKMIDEKVFQKSIKYSSYAEFQKRKHKKNYSIEDLDYLLRLLKRSNTKIYLSFTETMDFVKNSAECLYLDNIMLNKHDDNKTPLFGSDYACSCICYDKKNTT